MKSINEFHKFKEQKKKISMVTCYDFTSARILRQTGIDCILVGDSAAMTMHGHATTLTIDVDQLAWHVQAVRKGAPTTFIIGDLPFLAHRGSLDSTLQAVKKIMCAGAQAIKIEGVDGSEETIRHIVESGVPVMGHLGLTPQSIHQLGGFKVQATENAAVELLMSRARRLEEAGVFALVLECVPAPVAALVTKNLRIPTIGIGAGTDCSGQVLVWQDLLGMNIEFQPKFVRRFMQGFEAIKCALDQFDREVKSGTFPGPDEQY